MIPKIYLFSLLLLSSFSAQAAVTFTTSGNNLTMTFSENLVFTPSQDLAGSTLFLVIEDAFTDPLGLGPNYLTTEIGGTMTISDDGTNAPDSNGIRTATTGPTTADAGYGDFTIGDFDKGDLLFTFRTPTINDSLFIAANSAVTLSAGTYIFEGSATPQVPDFTSTQIFMTDNNLVTVSDSLTISPIPEPSGLLLISLGGVILSSVRRRAAR